MSALIRPPLTSTLFPYTTLFRSIPPEQPPVTTTNPPPAQPPTTTPPPPAAVGTPIWPILDRKSTRLNSSHVKNSYAVLRLKKKRSRRCIQQGVDDKHNRRGLTFR